MKILVFVKQVPDTDDVKLDPKTGNLKREGVKSMMNPYDANAVETALRIKETNGGTVCAISMGPPQADAVLKKALAMGCDESYLLSDRAFGGADTLATGYTLAQAAKNIGDYDLLIFGKCATDAETAQTAPIVAQLLGVPQATLVSGVEVRDGWAYCKRDLGDRIQNVKVRLPAMLSVTGDINQPRYPHPVNIMQCLEKPRFVWSAANGFDTERTGVKGSPSINKKIFEPEKRSTETAYFSGTPTEVAKAFVDALEAEHLI